ncbi:acyl-CoA dehydrogenase family protein [Changpingibacter yushuensis]|uniref:acyl-CoA dehydrogenase family protein n=1 Tax=Changpingibacter yushuensis TaxID=2758440 RepID=UPI00165D5449|nr:acyl-CoA dehydrogenase family protein [Changpingibacter yushuensis]
MSMWFMNEDREAVLQTTREFVEKEVAPRALEIDASDEFPTDLLKRAGELGLLAITVPEADGGLGMDQTTHALVLEEIAKTSPVLTVAMGAHTLLAGGLLQMLGTPEQKETYLKPAAMGEIILACGSTEAVGGDDQAEFTTRAVREGDEWVLNGGKVLISNIGAADVYIIIAVTADKPDPVTKTGLSAFIVPAGTPGLGIGQPEHKLGWHGSATGSISFSQCRVPAANLLGPQDGALQAMFISATAEFLSCGPVSLGIAEGAYEMARAYSMERIQMGQTQFDRFQVTRHKLVKMYTAIESLRGLVYSTYAQRDAGELELARGRLLKVEGARVSEEVARDAIQIMGGVGVIRETGVERFWRDAKVMAIGGASAEALTEAVSQMMRRAMI